MSLLKLPLYQEHIPTVIGQIWVWKVAESSYDGIDSKINWQRKEVVRMLQAQGYDLEKLDYKLTGQPVLMSESKEYISISHSQNWFALYIASAPVGIDIEVERISIAQGKDWFMNVRESSLYQTADALHLIWGAKEAYYKKLEGIIKDLREEVTITEIDTSSLSIMYNKKKAILYHRKIENAYLVWTVE